MHSGPVPLPIVRRVSDSQEYAVDSHQKQLAARVPEVSVVLSACFMRYINLVQTALAACSSQLALGSAEGWPDGRLAAV